MIHVFYHSADLDGHCSGAICKYAMPDAVLHGINYGDSFPWEEIGVDDTVYMVDFSLQPFSEMLTLGRRLCGGLQWIDHHKSAIEDFDKTKGSHFCSFSLNTEKAACELTWEWFFPNKPMPVAVYWLGRYDIWKHEDVPGSLEFQYGMRLYNTWPDNQEFWQRLFVPLLDEPRQIRGEGELLLRYEREQNKKFAAAYAFETELDGLRCIAVNKGFTNSLVFESVYDPEKHDAMLSFAYRGGKWTVSLYATKPEIDVSVICKARGGGGHKGAAGFQCDNLPFLGN